MAQHPRLSSQRGRLKSAAALVLAAGLALTAVGATYASWSVREPLAQGAVVTAGSAALSVTSPTGIGGQALYPGQSVAGAFTVQNTGTVPLELRVDGLSWPSAGAPAAASAFAGALTFTVWTDTGQGCASTSVPQGAWTGTFASASSPTPLGSVPAGGAVRTLCLAVQLAGDAPSAAQGGAVDAHLTIGAVQQ